MMRTIGAISDTHGLLRPQALAALAGCDPIIHAGDVGSPDVLARLGALAPVHAVRGNVDHGAWSANLPVTQRIESMASAFTCYTFWPSLTPKPPTTSMQ